MYNEDIYFLSISSPNIANNDYISIDTIESRDALKYLNSPLILEEI